MTLPAGSVVSPARLRRGLLAFGGAVVIAAAASVLIFAEAASAPSAGHVLERTRHFVSGARTLTYRAAVSASAPVGGSGALLVRSRAVTGSDALSQGVDFTTVEGNLAAEYKTAAGQPGLWVRAAVPARLATAKWLHATSLSIYEAAVLAARDSGSANATDVTQATLIDTLSSGDVITKLVQTARVPRRHGSRVRTIDVQFTPDAVFGAAGPVVDTLTGQFTMDERNRPVTILVHLRANPSTIDVRYDLTWNTPVTVSPPAPTDVPVSI